MIIARSPLRISLGGGASDLKSYYSKFEGFCISAAINKYIYVCVQHTTVDEALIRYSKVERVKDLNDIQHPIIREALKLVGVTETNIEITSMADIPSGSGLGSSSAFTAALLKALYRFKNKSISQESLAQLACHLEIDILKEPIGKQDQYITAYAGLSSFQFKKDERVIVKPLNLAEEIINKLENNLIMFSTGHYRSASAVLKDQNDKSKANDPEMLNNLHYIKQLGYQNLAALENGDLVKFGELMNEHWEYKKKRSAGMSNVQIDNWYDLAMKNGAISGKLIGAGSGGVLLFYVEDKEKLIKTMKNAGLREVEIKFDYEGTKII